MDKRKRRIRLKNRMIIGSVYLSVIVFVLSALCIDSASWIPTIVCGISELWIAFIFICNLPKKGEKKHGNNFRTSPYQVDEFQGNEEQRNIV